MKSKFTSMKSRLTTLHVGCGTCEMTEPVHGRKPILALLMRLLCAAVLVLPTFGAHAGVLLTTLHSFQQPYPNGANPHAGLVQGSDGNFYGTTSAGGENGNGTVFQLSANGALTSLHSFTGGNDGSDPEAGLIQGSDGNFYGTTDGTVFKISTNGALTTLHLFTGGDDGGDCRAGLVQGSDGYLYGTTYDGGINNHGNVFKITTNGALTSLHSFTGGDDGANPRAGLVQGSDGYLYGTTYDGGTGGYNGSGTVFKISTNGALTTLHLFTGGNDGRTPDAGLIQGRDGNFYGATIEGGVGGSGTVFKISGSGTLTTLYSFTGGDDGYAPGAALVQGSDGNFYGISEGGLGYGTLFKISTNGVLTTLYAFTWDPFYLSGGLIQGSDGNLYGTTAYNNDGNPGSGTEGSGTVFQISTNGALISLYFFTGGTEGANPEAGLVQGRDGNFYGTTDAGGPDNYGTVFQISTNGALSTLYSFTGGDDGANPEAGLVQGRDGNFYGTTDDGGAGIGLSGFGTVFQIRTDGALTTLYSFAGGGDGAIPQAAMVQGSDGSFYGTTSFTVFKMTPGGVLTTLNSDLGSSAALVQGSDGSFYGTTEFGGTTNYNPEFSAYGNGTVFKINTKGALTTLYTFGMRTNANGQQIPPLDGANPAAALVQGSDGNFYGTTSQGGTNVYGGTVFKISANGALTSLYSFTGDNDGGGPNGLVQGRDGNFYGTTQYGGTVTNQYGARIGGYGTVFRISTNGALTTLHSFTGGNDGANPQAGLVQGSDGNFYGTTYNGGMDDAGAVFEISPAGAFTNIYSFTGGNDGGHPFAALVQGSDGNFYGTTWLGGQGGAGTVFRLTIMPELQAVTVAHGKLSLAWSAEAEARYQLQYTSDLSSSNWINLTNTVTATGATLSTTDIVTNEAQRFYRLALVP